MNSDDLLLENLPSRWTCLGRKITVKKQRRLDKLTTWLWFGECGGMKGDEAAESDLWSGCAARMIVVCCCDGKWLVKGMCFRERMLLQSGRGEGADCSLLHEPQFSAWQLGRRHSPWIIDHEMLHIGIGSTELLVHERLRGLHSWMERSYSKTG